MNKETYNQINNLKNGFEFLHNNSYYYKDLNRNPLYFKNYKNIVDKYYERRVEDRISNINKIIDIISLVSDE